MLNTLALFFPLSFHHKENYKKQANKAERSRLNKLKVGIANISKRGDLATVPFRFPLTDHYSHPGLSVRSSLRPLDALHARPRPPQRPSRSRRRSPRLPAWRAAGDARRWPRARRCNAAVCKDGRRPVPRPAPTSQLPRVHLGRSGTYAAAPPCPRAAWPGPRRLFRMP